MVTRLRGRDGSPSSSSEGSPSTSRSSDSAEAIPTLYLDRYSLYTGERTRGAQRVRGDQTLLRGTLKTEAGDHVGEIYSTAFTMPGPIDHQSPRTSRMEFQNLHLADGTILGMGTTFASVDIPNIYSVIGGTGRYTGARGAYTFDHNPSVASSEGRAAIRFDVRI
jgi:hypothetical protein